MVGDIKNWLQAIGLSDCAERFRKQRIDWDVLAELDAQDLDELGLSTAQRQSLTQALADRSGPADRPDEQDDTSGIGADAGDQTPRQVTVMFCDLAGSTALSTQMDVEDLREVIHTFHLACERVIARFGGTIARYMGDATLTYFGYPHARPDDAERAVRAGLALVEATRDLQLPDGLTLKNRIGIASGPVVIGGLTGGGEAQAREVVGEAPILAAKLEPLAETYEVVIADTTREQAGTGFEYEDRGMHEMQGVAAPVHAWRVSGERSIEQRLEALCNRGGFEHLLDVDTEQLRALDAQALREQGLALGDRKRLLKLLGELHGAEGGHDETTAASGDDGRSEFEAERRQLTVMFCNLLGTAEIAEDDDELKRAVLQNFHGICEAAIGRYDGTIARYNADSVLAYFGYPRAHEDDAERAARAGIDIVEAVQALELERQPKLQSRIGIATGLVVVGDLIGSGEAQEREVLGETPNLAARLMALAQPDNVVIGPATHHLLGVLFHYEDLGQHMLKGFDDPIQAWQVVAEVRAESRFEALRWAGGLSPLVGRDPEIKQLSERWEQAEAGSGRIVMVAGEPGIGKSRIIEGLLETLADDAYVRLRYQCSAHYANSALYPFISQLERAAQFQRGDSDPVKLDKLAALLSRSSANISESIALIAPLLGVPLDERFPSLNLTPQRRRERTLDELLTQVEALSTIKPVLIILEDAQWIDPTSRELLGMFIERAADRRVLALITHRPEFEHDWDGHAHIETMLLSRLGREQGVAIAERLTGGKRLPRELLEHILSKTDGVPLFVEELTKTVMESGLLIDAGDHYELEGPLETLAIPATLQDSLIARFDRLGPAKQVVQVGATLGREFPQELIEAVSPLPEAELGIALAQLVESELLYCHGTVPQLSYAFKHGLVQDTAYSTLLRGRKRRLHAQIAQTMEGQFRQMVDTHPETLAHHYTEAKQSDQAVGWWYKAGQLGAERSANLEAINHLRRGLMVIPDLSDAAARQEHELQMQIALGQAYFAIRGFGAPEVREAYTRARTLCQGKVDTLSVLRVIVGLWNYHMVRGELHTALDLAEQRMTLSNQADNPLVLPGAQQNVGAIRFHLGEFDSALEHMKVGIGLYDQLAEKAQVFGSFDPRMGCLSYAAWALWMLGYADQAMDRADEMTAIAERLAHPVSIAHAQLYLLSLQQFRRDTKAVQTVAEAMLELSRENDFEYRLTQGGMLHGWALALQGRHEAGIDEIEHALADWRKTGALVMGPYYNSLLADACLAAGRWARGLEAVTEALELLKKSDERFYEAELHRLRGELLLGQSVNDSDSSATEAGHEEEDDGGVALASPVALTEVENTFKRALEVARTQRARGFELRTAVSLARLWQAEDKTGEALQLLERSYAWFTEGFDTPDLQAARALLTQLRT